MLSSIPSSFYLFGLQIHIYGITSALSYFLGVLITCLLAKKRGFKSDDIITLACYVIPLAVIGARLYYVLCRLDIYTNFVDIFKIWEGGLAFYGGLIGGAVGVGLYCIIHKKNFFALIDLIVVAMIFAQGVGRWGNFFNQEAYGLIVTDKNFQWFPFAVYIEALGEWHLATFFYESLWNFMTFAVLITLLFKVKFKTNGMIAAYYLIFYGTGRFFIEGLRTDSLYVGPFRISQVLSAIFVVIGITYIVINAIKNKNNPPLHYQDSSDKNVESKDKTSQTKTSNEK